MKNMLVVVDNIDNVKELLKKSLRLSSDNVYILVFEPSAIKTIETVLSTDKSENCHTVLIDAAMVKSDNKAEKVIEIAAHHNCDTIAITRQKIQGPERDFSFEKSLLKGLRKTNLLICSDKRWKPAMNIMATLDIENKNEVQANLNSAVFDVSVKVANNINGHLHFMTVIPISRISQELDIVESEEVLYKQGDKVKAKLVNYLEQKSSTIEYSPHITAGLPYNEIPSAAKKQKIDLVILGNVGRTGIKGLIVGNTAEKILQRLSVDVLIVKTT